MMTVRYALENLYLPNRPGLAKSTQARYRFEIVRWERMTSNPLLDSITTETFQQFRHACLSRGLKPSTIETGISTVVQVMRMCGPEQERRQGMGLIPKVPYVGTPLRRSKALLPTPSVEQLRAAWSHCSAAIWPRTADVTPEVFWQAWIGTLFVTGLRLSDALSAQRSQLAEDVLTVPIQKTGLIQSFPVPPWLVSILCDLPRWDAKLFPCRKLPHFIRRELRRICNAAGIPKITPHGLRRACITEWSALNSDCGSIIHGQGLGIRSRYVNPLRLLRKHLPDFPDLSAH